MLLVRCKCFFVIWACFCTICLSDVSIVRKISVERLKFLRGRPSKSSRDCSTGNVQERAETAPANRGCSPVSDPEGLMSSEGSSVSPVLRVDDGVDNNGIVEIVCGGDQRLKYLLRRKFKEVFTHAEVDDLIHLGAVCVKKNKFDRVMLPWTRRIEDGQVTKGSLVRVHTKPRRYPACEIDWRERVLLEDDDFIVLDKPSNVPFQPTPSNFRECLVNAAAEKLGFKLFGCQRLDAGASGCVALGKNKEAAARFHAIARGRSKFVQLDGDEGTMSDADEGSAQAGNAESDDAQANTTVPGFGSTRKYYLALSESPPPLGVHRHWIIPQSAAVSFLKKFIHLPRCTAPPQVVSTHPVGNDSKAVSLEVMKCSKLSSNNTELWESYIHLHTGKRHQIRCQMAALGAPLVGDTLYGPLKGITYEENELPERNSAEKIDCKPPLGEIGLHATRLSFLGREAVSLGHGGGEVNGMTRCSSDTKTLWHPRNHASDTATCLEQSPLTFNVIIFLQ